MTGRLLPSATSSPGKGPRAHNMLGGRPNTVTICCGRDLTHPANPRIVRESGELPKLSTGVSIGYPSKTRVAPGTTSLMRHGLVQM